jgi:hypothetical protein
MDEDEISQALKMFPGARRAANGIIIDDEDGAFFLRQITKEDPDLSPEEHLFLEFCAKSEIIRLRSIRSSHDYLLRLRANAIADSARFTRVMASRRKQFERNGRVWTLTSYYDRLNPVAKRYIERLPRQSRRRIRSSTFGFSPVAEANAICLRSIVGDIVVVSEALRFFYYFMSICFHGQLLGFELEDRVDAGLIALRIMNGSESLDFHIDPRAELAPRTEATINRWVDYMIQFTFGHEFAHMVLGHTSTDVPIHSVPGDKQRAYSEQCEFDADKYAVTTVVDRATKEGVKHGAFNVLMYLHLLQVFGSRRSEMRHFSVSDTHPNAISRIEALQTAVGDNKGSDLHDRMNATNVIEQLVDLLQTRIDSAGRPDLLTVYGSIHLAGLGGRPKIDRIDY